MFTVFVTSNELKLILSPTQSRITAMQQTRYSDKSLVALIVGINDNCLMLFTGYCGCSTVDEDAIKWTRYESSSSITYA